MRSAAGGFVEEGTI